MYFNCYLSHFIVSDVSGFLIRRQNRPDILSAGEEVYFFYFFYIFYIQVFFLGLLTIFCILRKMDNAIVKLNNLYVVAVVEFLARALSWCHYAIFSSG